MGQLVTSQVTAHHAAILGVKTYRPVAPVACLDDGIVFRGPAAGLRVGGSDLREHVPGTAGATIQSVLVTPAKKAKQGAVPHLSHFAHWDLADFRAWADRTLDVVRELRRTFVEPGDLAWRAAAAARLEQVRADAPGLARWLSGRPARDHLKPVA